MKENLLMDIEMEKVKNIIKMENYYLKVNFSTIKDVMEEGKNIIKVVNFYLKENI